MFRSVLVAASILALAACGGAPAPGGGTTPFRDTGVTGGTSGSSGQSSGTDPDGGTVDAGTPDAGQPAAVTYSLDCTGYVLDAQLTYHYEERDDGHVLTHCTGVSPEQPDGGAQSNDWGPNVTDGEAGQRDEGHCGYYLMVSDNSGDLSSSAGGVSCSKNAGADSNQCWYYDSGNSNLNGTEGVMSCDITAPDAGA